RLVDKVAEAADAMDHHPDIDIRWTTITFACASHSDGGVTAADIRLAHRINELAGASARLVSNSCHRFRNHLVGSGTTNGVGSAALRSIQCAPLPTAGPRAATVTKGATC